MPPADVKETVWRVQLTGHPRHPNAAKNPLIIKHQYFNSRILGQAGIIMSPSRLSSRPKCAFRARHLILFCLLSAAIVASASPVQFAAPASKQSVVQLPSLALVSPGASDFLTLKTASIRPWPSSII
jgi:hypothetical protein